MTEFNKTTKLTFMDCRAIVDIEGDEGQDQYTLCVSELQVNEILSSENNTHLDTSSVTEVYLGREELQELAKAIDYILGDPNA